MARKTTTTKGDLVLTVRRGSNSRHVQADLQTPTRQHEETIARRVTEAPSEHAKPTAKTKAGMTMMSNDREAAGGEDTEAKARTACRTTDGCVKEGGSEVNHRDDDEGGSPLSDDTHADVTVVNVGDDADVADALRARGDPDGVANVADAHARWRSRHGGAEANSAQREGNSATAVLQRAGPSRPCATRTRESEKTHADRTTAVQPSRGITCSHVSCWDGQRRRCARRQRRTRCWRGRRAGRKGRRPVTREKKGEENKEESDTSRRAPRITHAPTRCAGAG